MVPDQHFAALLPEDPEAASNTLPVVVLMGWAGALRDGALLKYAEFLAQQGYPTVRSVQPMAVAFSPLESPRRRWALSMLHFLEQQGLWPQRQMVLYAFSNGGAFVVEQIQLIAETDPRYVHLPASVAGFIFDSAPAYMHPGILNRVIETAEPPSLSRWLKATYFSLSTRLQPLLSGGRDRRQSFWENMERLDWGRPFMLFYSSDDELCDGDKVAELVQQKRAAGQDVAARRWEQSGHVSHFRHHRQEYSALLLHFLAALHPQGRQAQEARARL